MSCGCLFLWGHGIISLSTILYRADLRLSEAKKNTLCKSCDPSEEEYFTQIVRSNPPAGDHGSIAVGGERKIRYVYRPYHSWRHGYRREKRQKAVRMFARILIILGFLGGAYWYLRGHTFVTVTERTAAAGESDGEVYGIGIRAREGELFWFHERTETEEPEKSTPSEQEPAEKESAEQESAEQEPAEQEPAERKAGSGRQVTEKKENGGV